MVHGTVSDRMRKHLPIASCCGQSALAMLSLTTATLGAPNLSSDVSASAAKDSRAHHAEVVGRRRLIREGAEARDGIDSRHEERVVRRADERRAAHPRRGLDAGHRLRRRDKRIANRAMFGLRGKRAPHDSIHEEDAIRVVAHRALP